MRPDGIPSSPENNGLENEAPLLQGPRVNARRLGVGQDRDSQATAGGHAFSTTQRPARAKKNYRPAQVLFDHSTQRRSSEQVRSDQAKAKAEAAAAEAAAIAHQQSQKDRVAALEDAMQANEYAQSLEDVRPDLHINHKSATNTDVDTLSDTHLNPSQSEEFLTGWEGEEKNQDQDYVMPSDNESDASAHDNSLYRKTGLCTTGKAKFKPQRGNFRAAVNDARQVPPNPPPSGSQLKKRKEPDSDLPPPVDGNASTKRTKTSNPGGLVTNWKQSVGLLEHVANKHPIDFFDDEDVTVEGEFDNAEGPDMLNAVRASKPSTVKIESKMSDTKFTRRPINKSTRPKNNKFVVDDLPFPQPRAAYTAKWQKVFRPTVLCWASTYSDPYATNTLLYEAIVLDMWDAIYPDINLDKKEREVTADKLVFLAGNILHDWRTTIGTAALTVVRNHFLQPANHFHKERIAKVVEWCLDNLNFVYGAPYAEAHKKQAFRSDFILNVYAVHLKKIAGSAIDYGYQRGALALCAAATERALGFWASGEDLSMKMDDNGKSRVAVPFSDMEWGAKTRGWALSTVRLNIERWSIITAEATVRSKKLLQDEANSEGALEEDPRAVLEL